MFLKNDQKLKKKRTFELRFFTFLISIHFYFDISHINKVNKRKRILLVPKF